MYPLADVWWPLGAGLASLVFASIIAVRVWDFAKGLLR